MARRHGWQLPAHSFQVLATTVFFLLSIAFYAFFAPFLGKHLYEFLAVAVYSIFAFSVLILYIRCAAIDPADSGILIASDGTSAYKSQRGMDPGEPNQVGLNPDLKTGKKKATTCSEISCCFCSLMVKEDCRNNIDTTQQQPNNDDGLFCTLCNAEVGKLSKHCRSCDKCVDGFDHHCRWLNNCIGRKNYVTFLLLMATSLAWVAVQCGVGIAVLVRCFFNKRAIQNEAMDKLGDVFSRVPLTIIVAICTALALIAMFPLGELFFFHMILIRKGITTYDYVIAMRTQSEPTVNEHQSLSSSPLSSAPTAISGSSLGLQYKGSWCTPPRITVNNPDEIMPHLEPNSIPSNIDPDAPRSSESAKRGSKTPVRISAWKLSKLDSNEAMRAAAKARASSSVLRPISSRMEHEADRRSSGYTSSINSHAGTPTSLHFKGSYPPSRASREDQETRPNTPTTLNSPPGLKPQHHLSAKHFNPMFQSSMDRSHWSTVTSEGEESMNKASFEHGVLRSADLSTATNASSLVYWDQEAGRFVSSQNSAGSSSRAGSHAEFVYSGQSIFFGGPLSNERTRNSLNGNDLLNQQQQHTATIGRGSSQLPVFLPGESNKQSK